MVSTVHIIGIVFVLIMLYLTFLFYKKNHYNRSSFVFWNVVWVLAIVLLLVERSVFRFVQGLHFARAFDLYLSFGLMFVMAVAFYTYVKIERQDRRLEELVKEVAIKRVKKKK
jgi:hypothetical protein